MVVGQRAGQRTEGARRRALNRSEAGIGCCGAFSAACPVSFPLCAYGSHGMGNSARAERESMMSRTTLAAVLFTAAGCAMSAPASAVTQSRVQIETGSNMCTLSVPTIDSKIRPRANGFKNEGTTNQFVICSFDAPPGAYYINGTAFSAVYLWLISLDGVARSVTCTGVNSLPGTYIFDPVFVPKTLSVASTSDWTEYAWAPADFGGTSTIPFSSGAFSVTCVLPPNVSIVAGRADSLEDVGS